MYISYLVMVTVVVVCLFLLEGEVTSMVVLYSRVAYNKTSMLPDLSASTSLTMYT